MTTAIAFDAGLSCRDAALAFMEGARSGWTKRDLARWLVGPYAHATRRLPRESVATPPGHHETDPDAIAILLVRTRQQLLVSLEQTVLSYGVLEFAGDALARHIVRRVVGLDGAEVFVPVDVARMRLRDRVRSLFAADYLDDPAAYNDLLVCHHCEAVVFDAAARRRGICDGHRRSSGFVTLADRNQEPSSRVCSPRRA